jgi:hypothetical protein
MASHKFKTSVEIQSDIKLNQETASRAVELDSNGKLRSSTVTSTELGYLAGVTSNVQDQITDAQDAADDAQSDATQALSDAADALAAAQAAQADVDDLVTLSGVAVNATDLGTFTGTTIPDASDVKEALQALETAVESAGSGAQQDIDDHIDDTSGAHAASAISNTPSGNLAATDVQAALNELQSDVDSRIPSSEKGAVNGVATLDESGKVPSSQLPSYVDDVLEFSNLSSFPAEGESGKIYIDLSTNVTYRWSGSVYIQITSGAVASVFNRTGVVTAQNGDYTASNITNVPAGTIAAIDVQAAINELDGDAQAALSAANDAQADATQALSDAADALAAAEAAQEDIDDHINASTGAHAASAISVAPAGNLSSTDVQAALEELQDDIDNFVAGSDGDIPEASFVLANNQTSAANVTGFAFSSSAVRGFEALVSVEIDATADLYETFKLIGINKAGSFDIAVSSVGDESGVAFSITAGGQVQYTSSNLAGFSSGSIKYRAITTSI